MNRWPAFPLSLWLVLVGCVPSPPALDADAGSDDRAFAARADAGVEGGEDARAIADAGMVGLDAALSSADAGAAAADAGAALPDAGTTSDAGAASADAEAPPADAGTVLPDAEALADAGEPPADAGEPRTDAGAARPDAGAMSDAGTPVMSPQCPSRGGARLIGTNTAEDVRPPWLSSGDWQYALFESYGGGTFVEDYSSAGAYVIANTGGHRHPPNVGAAIFDFSAARWSRLDPAGGALMRSADFDRSELSGSPDWEIAVGGVAPETPAPSHTYMNVLPLPSRFGGGARGSALVVIRTAVSTNPVGSQRSFRLDLSSGDWSRYSQNTLGDVVSNARSGPEAPSALDSINGRYYQLPQQPHDVQQLGYLDVADRRWHGTPTFNWPPTGPPGPGAFIDEARRLLIVQSGSSLLRAFDLDDLASGPHALQLNGTMPGDESRWELNPADGSFYAYPGTGRALYKLTPPQQSPLTQAWTVQTVAIRDSFPEDTDGRTRHYTRFFYVPALGCFGWVADATSPVALVTP